MIAQCHDQIRKDMEIFDGLPPKLRDLLNEVPMTADSVDRLLRMAPEDVVIETIKNMYEAYLQ